VLNTRNRTDGVECLVARLVDEDPFVGDGSDDIDVVEVADESNDWMALREEPRRENIKR
jgi:hypothetical protein